MLPFLYEHQNKNAPERTNGKRFWGYPTRMARCDLIAVHTTESAFDLIGEDTGAEGVAGFQSTTDRPSSYHKIVDRDSTVTMLPDEATAFGVVGYNSRALSVSLAMRAADWSEWNKAKAADPMLRRAARVVADWCKKYDIPPILISKAQADAGQRGITSHGRLDPGRRSDPGTAFPWDTFLILVRAALGGATYTEEEPVLIIGAAGPAVAFMQECLKAEANKQSTPRDWGKDLPVDGKFGTHMQQAVDSFQRGWGLDATGKIDALTAAVLTHFAPDWA